MPNLRKTPCYENAEHYGFGLRAMEKVKVCPECGAAAKVTEQLCGECGARLPKDNLFQSYKKQSRYCSVCDTVVPTKAKFCPKCGTQLKIQEE